MIMMMIPKDDRCQVVVVVMMTVEHGTHHGFDVVVRKYYSLHEASVLLLEQRHPSMKHHSRNNNTILLLQILVVVVVEEYRIPFLESFERLTESSYSSLSMIVQIYRLCMSVKHISQITNNIPSKRYAVMVYWYFVLLFVVISELYLLLYMECNRYS